MKKYIEKECKIHGLSTFKKVNKGHNYYSHQCIKCLTTYQVKYKQSLKIKSVEYKGGSCQKCGYNKCIAALDFHHLDPSKKDFNFSHKKAKFETLKVELDKCILLCANCHREVHANEQN